MYMYIHIYMEKIKELISVFAFEKAVPLFHLLLLQDIDVMQATFLLSQFLKFNYTFLIIS